jgi:5-methylcytosine-specific restriction endonuclease McrA
MNNKEEIIKKICQLLTAEKPLEAAEAIQETWPHVTYTLNRIELKPEQTIRIFIRDSFTCRYCGKKLVIVPAMSMISRIIPEYFPYEGHWSTNLTHPAVRELAAECDHVIPKVKGGQNNDENLVASCHRCNTCKDNWRLEEIGMEMIEPNDKSWDGLSGLFIKLYEMYNKPKNKNFSDYYRELKNQNYPLGAWGTDK